MTKPKRNYSQKTIKVLFTLSKNQCAHPDCTNPLIEPATEVSDVLVTAQICHIYALSEDGPRGKSGLTEKELNSPENLILLCPNHHGVVDGQYETYPADTLKDWKQTHESDSQKRLSEDLESVQLDVFSHPCFPTALVDQKIEEEVNLIRKSRFFGEFDRVNTLLAFSRRLLEGELSGGTDAVKSRALAWCARILSPSEELDKAEEVLKNAKVLGTGPEIEIARAFIYSQKGDKKSALNILASIDLPMSRSAALMVVAHHEGSIGATTWLETAGINASDLCPDGKLFLLMRTLELFQWEKARKLLDELIEEDLCEAPALFHMVAITHLLCTVPNELRVIVLNQVPFEAASFPLVSDASAIDARRVAHRHFIKSAEVAQQLNCHGASTIDDEYALWLELMDPDETDKGRQRLEAKLRDPKSALRLVRLGLQFGIKLDLEAVEREIERQIALHGDITQNAAIARFALAFTQKTPEDVASYIAWHRDELVKFFDKKSLLFLEIDMLSRAGLPEKANECLDNLVEEGLTETEENLLQRMIAEAEGTDSIQSRKEQFEQTDSLSDLASLVDELEARGDWNGICENGKILFERTHSLHDAERLAISLSNTQKNKKLVEFIKANEDLVGQSKTLPMLYCWALYHEGELVKARSELAKLSDNRDNANYRALQINLGISLGDWISLSAFVANEYKEKDKRNAQDLIGAAQLALHLGSPQAKELLFAAAGKANNDAGVLAAAYFLASNAGWEDETEVFAWLHEAAELSGDDGPIQKMTIKDVLDRKPEWDRRESETWGLLSCGDIPMFLAAQSLNKSLVDLMLFPALANLTENDPRRRGAIPAYSGKRQPIQFDTRGAIGMDATALLTLSFLNLIDKAFDAFDMIHVPHSTLAWLFEEKQKAEFHQLSRIRRAHQVRHLLATDVLEKFISSTIPDSDLSDQVGDELSLLISEAEKVRDDDTQHIVIRSSPVYRLASLMEEEADLAPRAAVLSSCEAIVDKLRQKGQITAEEEKKARSYLQFHEKPWSHQPEITDGAILYLGELAITNFLHLGILEKIKDAGFRLVASPRAVSQTNEIISYESNSIKVSDALEHLRFAINSRIESGNIRVGRRRNIDALGDQSLSRHPSFSVIDLAKDCAAIISDDRFLNQHPNIGDSTAQAPIFSTLDLIDALVSTGSISPEDRLEYRTMLRRAGYFFLPISDDELANQLNASAVKDNKLIETAELKAIRESILRVRMSTWLQLPKEAIWLDTSLKTHIRALKGLWKGDQDLSSIKVRSDWILDQVDILGWVHSFDVENGDNIIKTGRGVHLLMVLAPPLNAPEEFKDEYWSWVEDRVLAPIKEQYPNLYSWFVDWYRKIIAEMADMDMTGGGTT